MALPQSAFVLLALVAIVSVPLALATGQDRPPKQDYNSGEYLYRTHCASCHGQTGRGDGPAASTFQKALSDLATLSSRAGGQFPRAEVTRIVDGRHKTPGHTPGGMPEWGRVLQSLEGDDRVARQRIEAVVTYLESIQRKNE